MKENNKDYRIDHFMDDLKNDERSDKFLSINSIYFNISKMSFNENNN